MRNGAVGLEVEHLGGDARIARAQEADVGNPLAQHQEALESHPEGQPGEPVEPGRGEHRRVGQPALPHLDPPIVAQGVNLAPREGIGVDPGFPPPPSAGQEGVGEDADHLVKLVGTHLPSGDAPEVELVGGAGVEAVDGVATVRNPGAGDEDVVGRVGGESVKSRGNQSAGVAAQDALVIHIAGVAGVAGDGLGWVAEPVVVVGPSDDPGSADHAYVAAPCLGQ